MIVGIALPPEVEVKKGMLAGLPALLSCSEVPCEVYWELNEKDVQGYCEKVGLPHHMAYSLVSVGIASEDEATEIQQRALAAGFPCGVTLMVRSQEKTCPTCSGSTKTGINMVEIMALASRLGGQVIDLQGGVTVRPITPGRSPKSNADGQARPLTRCH